MTQLDTVQADRFIDTAANAIRSFQVSIPEEALVDLSRRLAATRWPDPETVTDQSQGVQLARIQALVPLVADRL
jgi:hypothetical protein